jgi:hypothetical protein
MNLSITETAKNDRLINCKPANLKFQKTYPGDKPDRQPVHTVYGGANLFKSDTTRKDGEIALRSLKSYAPNFVILARVLKLDNYEHFQPWKKTLRH